MLVINRLESAARSDRNDVSRKQHVETETVCGFRAVLAGSYDVLFDLIKSGDILLIACAVVADGIGRAWIRGEDEKTNPQIPRTSAPILMLVSFVIAVGCVITYAAAHSGPVLLVSMLRITAAAASISAAVSAKIVLVVEV